MKNNTRCGAPLTDERRCPYPLIDRLDGRGKRCAVYGFGSHPEAPVAATPRRIRAVRLRAARPLPTAVSA